MNGCATYTAVVKSMYRYDEKKCCEIKSTSFLRKLKENDITDIDEINVISFFIFEKYKYMNTYLEDSIDLFLSELKKCYVTDKVNEDLVIEFMKMTSAFLKNDYILNLEIIEAISIIAKAMNQYRYDWLVYKKDETINCFLCCEEGRETILNCCNKTICFSCHTKTFRKCPFCNFNKEKEIEIDLNDFISLFNQLL